MTTYRSKIGLELILPIAVIVGGIGILIAYEQTWIGLVFILLVTAFIAHVFLTTYYIIDNNILMVKCGFFIDKKINLDTIKEIRETSNPIGSPATSLDRLLIAYNRYDIIIISPKEKRAFITHLTNINPDIKVILKNNRKQRIITS